MRITTIIEDTSDNCALHAEHGLSFYIQTDEHNILADTGASPLTWENASHLGIDLFTVDTVIISHGHYDHAGGVLSLAKSNPRAAIYMQSSAAGDFYHGEKYIGIDKSILSLPNLHLISGDFRIDDRIFVFSGIKGRRLFPSGNRELTVRIGDTETADDFSHEQCLVISENGKNVLISGCAHNGILNILDRYSEIFGSFPDAVVSGFHMIQKTPYTDDDKDRIISTAHELSSLGADFYTGHCTGDDAFEIMKRVMCGRLHRIRSGDTITV